MATRKTNPAAQQTLDVAATPVTALAPMTVTPPDVTQATAERTSIEALATFLVQDDQTYVQANGHFTAVATYLDGIERLFEPSVSYANKAHKALTQLRGFFLNPGETAKANLNRQILGWKQKKEAERLAEERRQREAEEARLAELRRDAEAEQSRLRTEAEARQAELMPWEEAEPIPEPAPIVLPEPVAIRLPSTVPMVAGGPSSRKLPWAARFINGDSDGRILFLNWVLQNPVDRLGFIDWDSVLSKLRPKATELGADLGKVVPGVEGFQGETLAR